MNSGLEDIIDEVEKSSVADLGMSQEYIDILNIMSAAATQYLFDQKLRAENIDIDGDYLSFAKDNIFGVHNGLFISNVAMTTGSYFEVEIINRGGADGSIGIGMVPDNYRRCAFPGWYRSSAGYHSDDGQIFIENSHGRPFGPPCGNSDKMGCGVAMVTSQSVDFFFTRNGNMYLFDQKLRAENIDIDGDYLSFAKDNIFGVHNGLFISNVAMTTGSYFEVEIINRGGADGYIGIGMVPDNYRRCAFPGWYRSSAGYHSDDGRIFIENSHGRPFGPPCGNSDKMGCGVAMVTSQSVDFFFTRNGNMIDQRSLRTGRPIYPAIALDTQGQKVKVILNATLPKF